MQAVLIRGWQKIGSVSLNQLVRDSTTTKYYIYLLLSINKHHNASAGLRYTETLIYSDSQIVFFPFVVQRAVPWPLFFIVREVVDETMDTR